MVYILNKKNALLMIFGAVLLLVGFSSAVFAQTTTPASVPSAYATDVQAGQAAIQNDPAVAASAQEVNSSESDAGEVDNEPAEVTEVVEPQEATEAADATGSNTDNVSGSGDQTTGNTTGGQQ